LEDFKDILKSYREEHNLTQAEMSVKLGISERMYADYEKGKFKGSKIKQVEYLKKLSGNNGYTREQLPEIVRGLIQDIRALKTDIALLKELVLKDRKDF
jgi:transcriptional regulator with XRE-family HTH domain